MTTRPHIWHRAYPASLVVLPILAALIAPVVVPAVAIAWNVGLPIHIAPAMSLSFISESVIVIGFWPFMVFLANHVGAFGLVIVLSLWVSRRWNPKRVYGFMLVAIAVPWCFHAVELWKYSNAALRPNVAQEMGAFWLVYTFTYPAYAGAAGIIAGWLLSMLPVFTRGRQYWLDRGRCPNCQYDLRNDIGHGCPECGWNRAAGDENLETSRD